MGRTKSDKKSGSKYTFDSFAVTDANRTAFEKAKQFAENVDSKSLAIFGGTATGKTHMLYSVKNAIKQNNPELTVILTTTADIVSTLKKLSATAVQQSSSVRSICRRMSY